MDHGFFSLECFPFIRFLLEIDTALMAIALLYDTGLSIHNSLFLGTGSPGHHVAQLWSPESTADTDSVLSDRTALPGN